ncbi:chorismate synthase [Chloroflexota bacterium]
MRLRYLTAGESHGRALTAILEGIPAGLPLPEDVINKELARRQKGYGSGARMKIEKDTVKILGGVMEGKTTGAPLALLIENRDHEKWQDKPIAAFTTPRPGHADLTGVIKYGYSDIRPTLERASARETAARVAVGAVCKQLLSQFDVVVGGWVFSIGGIEAQLDDILLEERLEMAEKSLVRCPDERASERMITRIKQIMKEGDTLGGIIEVVALGLPPGLGSYVHWDRRLDARLGAILLSVPAIKGVEIGPAFENAHLSGTNAHDSIRLNGDELVRTSNRAGGLEGGITNGQPLILRAAMKPIATTLTPQETVDLHTGEEVLTQYERSDFCPVPRAVPILEAVVAYVLSDTLLEKLGGDSIDEMISRFDNLRQVCIRDVDVDGEEHIYWETQE